MRRRLLVGTMLATAVLGGASAASAQVAPPATPVPPQANPNQPSEGAGSGSTDTAQPNTVQEVVVTGSLIRAPNLTAQAPVTTVTSQEFKFQGTTQVESLLDQLPQVIATQNSTVSNGSTGTATVNLRNLGASRTLVLVDGTRLMPGDPNSGSAADLNNIPAALVDRVDVLTGGASATYGSDAVAGVVNFIMKKNFEGVQMDGQYSFFNHSQGNPSNIDSALSAFGAPIPGDVASDGRTWDASLLIGANSPDDKGNVTFYGTYRHLDPVTQDSRDYSACGSATDFVSSFSCLGSSNSAYGRFDGTAAGGSYTNSTTPGVFRTYSGARDAFNFGPYNFLQRQDERYTAGAFAHYKFNDMLEVYGNFMFADDRTVAQIAPSGLFRGTGPNGGATYSINCDNPLLSAQQATVLCGANAGVPGTYYTNTIGYRFAGLPRQDDLRHTNYRYNIGARGDLGDGWNYDAYLQYGVTTLSENYQNDVSVSRVQNALLVGRDADGNPACQSVIAAAAGSVVASPTGSCVPLNIFQALSTGLTPAQLAYVVAPGFQSAQEDERIAHVQLSGDLGRYGIKSPLAQDPVTVALGAEYREESLDYRTDAEFSSGDLSGQGGPKVGVNGSFDVYELFGEANMPIAQRLPGIYDLSLDAAYRFSEYSSVGETDTYKGSFSYSPIRDLRLRGGYNRAVRAPNVTELFSPTVVGLGSFADPCASEGGAAPTATLEQCLRTGLTAAQYNSGLVGQCPSDQCSILTGGNTALRPETSDTYTLGFVYQPSWLRGFTLSMDAFDINVSHYIGTIPAATALSQCTSTGDPQFCSLISRDPTLGILFGQAGYVINTNVNTGVLRTKGVDVDANYSRRLADFGLPDYGSLVFSVVGTYTGELYNKPIPGLQGYDCIGRYGPVCGEPQPRWKHQARVTWNSPWNVSVSAQWRFIEGSRLDLLSANPGLTGGAGFDDPPDATIGDFSYLDLAVIWKIRNGLTMRAGVNNLLDNDPPVLDSNNVPVSGPGNFGNANTFPGVYDSLGRNVFVGVTASF